MIIVSAVQGKGGVGKTTILTGFMLHASLVRNLKTLAIDFDNQANLTGSFMLLDDAKKHGNALDLVQGKKIDPITINDNLDLIPATRDLLSLDSTSDLNTYFLLGDHINEQYSDKYDLVLIDTPGHLGPRTSAALTCSDFLFSPTELSEFASQALLDVFKLVKTIKARFNPNLVNAGIIPNLVRGIRLCMPTLKEERETFLNFEKQMPELILGLIGQRNAIKKAFSSGSPITGDDQSSMLAEREVYLFSEKLLNKIGIESE